MRPSRLPARWRLTLLLDAVVLVAAVAVVAVTYGLVSRHPTGGLYVLGHGAGTGTAPPRAGGPVPLHDLRLQVTRQQHAVLRQLLEQSSVAVGIVVVLSTGVSWYAAGRVLGPLRRITDSARRISATNLHERLAWRGPDDEIQRLAATFDAMVGRLEASFDAQRSFVANASHELRTPMAAQRASIEVALAHHRLDAGRARAVLEGLLEIQHEQERLVGALLTLARSDRGAGGRDMVDLAVLADRAVAEQAAPIRRRGLRAVPLLDPAPVRGDAELLAALVTNLVGNAVAHNVDFGWIEIHTAGTRLRVVNSGAVVAPGDVDRLLRPFERARERHGDGHGLGLALVASVAASHGAGLLVTTRPEGGLDVTLDFAAGP